MKTPAPTLSNRAAARFMRLREIQLREIQLGLRFLCACAHRGEGSSPVLDSFPQALRARSRTFSTSKRAPKHVIASDDRKGRRDLQPRTHSFRTLL